MEVVYQVDEDWSELMEGKISRGDTETPFPYPPLTLSNHSIPMIIIMLFCFLFLPEAQHANILGGLLIMFEDCLEIAREKIG